MPRLIAPNGATVSVSDEKAERLADQGFKSADDQPAKPARRTRKTKSDDE